MIPEQTQFTLQLPQCSCKQRDTWFASLEAERPEFSPHCAGKVLSCVLLPALPLPPTSTRSPGRSSGNLGMNQFIAPAAGALSF